MKKYFLFLLVLSFLTVGCESTLAPPTTVFTSPNPTEAIAPTGVIPKTNITRKCSNISISHSWDNPILGTLVLVSSNTRENIFLDMNSGTRYPISKNKNDVAVGFNVSPNRKWLAYAGAEDLKTTDSLIVQSADGQESFRFPINYQEWQIIAYWLNNETLVLWNHASPLDNIILFNPFTGDKQVMRNEYPNIMPEDGGWGHSWPSVTIYDPLLDQVIYLGMSENGYQPYDATLILWNVAKNQQVTKISDFGYTLVHPVWKLDGSGLVFVKSLTDHDPSKRQQDELFFLSSGGEIKLLTKLSDMYSSPSIDSASLSPDARFLAFEIVTNFRLKVGSSNSDRRILILDMATLELIDYCLVPEQFAQLTWSPDSRYLAFSQPLSSEDAQTLVLDVLNGSVFVAAEHLRPEGWLNSEK